MPVNRQEINMADWTEADMPDQTGVVAIVTGANGGIGYETARALAAKGAEMIIASRTPAKGEDAVLRIRKAVPNAKVRFEQLDLASLASIKGFAERVSAAHPAIDLLINNAGVMALPQKQVTADGFEMQFG